LDYRDRDVIIILIPPAGGTNDIQTCLPAGRYYKWENSYPNYYYEL